MKTTQQNGKQPGLLIDDLHYLCKANNQNQINLLEKLILNHAREISGKKITSLENLHHIFEINEINSFRLSCFNLINNNEVDWALILKDLAEDLINERVGPDYLIQLKANISIQMPNDETSILPIHSDCISGDSPWQHNLWIPLTKASKSAAMFLVSKENTMGYMQNIQESNSKNRSGKHDYSAVLKATENYEKFYLDCKKGDILMFSPLVLHGNNINREVYTRVSINIRIKSLYSPNSSCGSIDRESGTYYKVGNISPSSAAAIEFDDLMQSFKR